MRGKYSNRPMCGGAAKIAGCTMLALFSCLEARAQVDADFSAYCREHYPGSQYEKTEQSWGIQHNCNQRGTRQGIDLSEACRITTGNPAHRTMGIRVICDKAASGEQTAAQGIAGPLDLNAWCRTNYTNSIPETRIEPTGIKHYCRRPGVTGGFTLQAIDLARACQEQRNVSGFLEAGKQVVCLRSGATAAAGGGRAGGGGGAGGSRNFPPLKPEDVVDSRGTGKLAGKNVKYANLQGCGNGDPEFRMRLPPTSMRRGLGDQTFDYMGLTMPCPGLKGGKVVLFQKVCNEFSGANPPMEARLLPEGLPVCWKVGRRKWPPRLRAGEAGWGLNSKSLTGVCNEAYLGRPMLPQEQRELNITSLLKYKARSLQIECFYIKTDVLIRLLRSGEKTSLLQDTKEGGDVKKPASGRQDGNTQATPADTKSLSEEAFAEELAKARKAVGAAESELDEILNTARYIDVDPESLKKLKEKNEARYEKKKKEIDAAILKLRKERGKEIDEKKLASECSSMDACAKLKLKAKYNPKIQHLEETLKVFKEDMADELLRKHGDKESREKLKQYRSKLKSLRASREKLEREEIIREQKSLENARKMGPSIPGLDDSDGPLLPPEDDDESGRR